MRAAALVAALAVAGGLVLVPASTRAADSLAVRCELGASADASNEQFYEQTYTDTTFLGRRLHGTPEGRVAAVAAMDLAGSRGGGRWAYTARPEVTLGDLLTRMTAAGAVRFRPDDRWRLVLEPRFEFERDRSFDLDRRRLLVASTAVARRRFDEGADVVDLRVGGELLDTPGSRDPFLLAHRVTRAVLAWDHDGMLGLGGGARYEADLRTFPDSSSRDHQEHQLELAVRRDFLGGHSVSALAAVTRRVPLRDVAGTRDRFAEGRGELRGTWHLGNDYAIVGALEGDGYRYDRPDSLVDFDYVVVRADLHVRREIGGRIWLAAGPRAEVLTAPWNPAERYQEVAAAFELERLDARRWWLLSPSVGRRGYESSENGASTDPSAIHSSYLFGEVQVLGDEALPGRWRVRATTNARVEKHDDPSQDSRSLYFSLDLRRLF